ncbi:hypothetical protein IGI49_002405 [Enterococcus sp. AZ071]
MPDLYQEWNFGKAGYLFMGHSDTDKQAVSEFIE